MPNEAKDLLLLGGFPRISTDRKKRAATTAHGSSTKSLLERKDIFLRADFLQDLRPHRHADFTEVRLPQKQHQRPRLSDPAADRKGNLIFQNRTMIGQLQKVGLPRQHKLALQDLLRDPIPIELSSCRRLVTGFHTRMSPFNP